MVLSPSFQLADLTQLSDDAEARETSLLCRNCNHPLGVVDQNLVGWRVQKWSIGVTTSSSERSNSVPKRAYSIQKWISARLLFLIENEAVRKFHIHPELNALSSIHSLLVWVFTPDLLFSSSIPSTDRHDPTRAMKVFFQAKTFHPPKAGEPESAAIEEIVFPEELYKELENALQKSQQLLPVNARRFQGWEVGLLERFEVGEVKESLE